MQSDHFSKAAANSRGCHEMRLCWRAGLTESSGSKGQVEVAQVASLVVGGRPWVVGRVHGPRHTEYLLYSPGLSFR